MQAAFFRACGLSSRGDAVPPGYVSGSGETGNDTPPLVRTADEAAPPRREQRNKSPAELDFYGEFYAALCGAPVLPVLPKAKCGRRLRPKGAKKARRRRAFFSYSFLLLFYSFSLLCLISRRKARASGGHFRRWRS